MALLTLTTRSGAGRFVLATFRAPYRLCYTLCLIRLSGYSAGCGITELLDALFLIAVTVTVEAMTRFSVDVEPTVCVGAQERLGKWWERWVCGLEYACTMFIVFYFYKILGTLNEDRLFVAVPEVHISNACPDPRLVLCVIQHHGARRLKR